LNVKDPIQALCTGWIQSPVYSIHIDWAASMKWVIKAIPGGKSGGKSGVKWGGRGARGGEFRKGQRNNLAKEILITFYLVNLRLVETFI
jgi:hypothetical protein